MARVRLKQFIGRRVKGCRQDMTELGLDGLIVTDPADVTYLTGFLGHDSVLVVTNRRRVLVTDSRYVTQVRRECPGLAVRVRREPMAQAVAGVLEKPPKSRKKQQRVVGMDPEAVTVSAYRAYRRALGRGLKTVPSPVRRQRVRKDPSEIAAVRKAVRVAEGAMERLWPSIGIGVSERQLSAGLDYEMAVAGGTAPAFETIAAFGSHAAQPHARSGQVRLRANQPMLFDWGATVDGYRSDLTRCYVVGRIPPPFAEAYQRVAEAQLAAIEAVKPGARLKDIDAAARRVLKRLPGCYQHGTGHGLGLQVHEGPVVADGNNGICQAGMIVTIEPGIYLPGRFGVRIEDDVLVTARGRTVLSKLPKTLEDVRL